MKSSYTTTHWLFVLFLFLGASLSAQNTPTSYSLKIQPIISDYSNILGSLADQSIQQQWTDWIKVNTGKGDYNIHIQFAKGLEPLQYHRKKISRRQYIYQVKYSTPIYNASVTNLSGNIILLKEYGGHTAYQTFGIDDQYASPDTLASAWRKYRDAFYELEEAKYNHIEDFLNDFFAIVNDGAAPMISENINSTQQNNNTTVINRSDPERRDLEKEDPIQEVPVLDVVEENQVVEGDEKIVTAISEIREQDQTTLPPSTPPAEENDDMSAQPQDAPPIPKPQRRDEVKKEEKPRETEAERKARLERIEREWKEMEEEDIEKHNKNRVRHLRLGLRLLYPNIAGAHAEVLLPLLHNHISIVGDYSQVNFGIIPEFVFDEDIHEDIGTTYQYYSIGGNYYFYPKYARGWYAGASYLRQVGITNVKVSIVEGNPRASTELDALALRIGLNIGRKAFFFGAEAGVGIPLGNIEGDMYTKDNGVLNWKRVDKKASLIPILNLTLGLAF